MQPTPPDIQIFTDGSYNAQRELGVWVALIFVQDTKTTLSGIINNTTHNRMELVAVINAIKHVQGHHPPGMVTVFSDSQYVIGLIGRREALLKTDFKTRSGNQLVNADLVLQFYNLVANTSVVLEKVKAHQRKNGVINHNIEADKLCRQLLRQAVHQSE